MQKFVTLSIATAALIGASGIAYAQAEDAPAREPLTRAQVEQRSAEAFGRLDANKDGVLNQADRDAKRAQMFDRIDANKDGSISRDEFAARHNGRGERAGMAGSEHGEHAGMGRGHHGGKRGMVGMGGMGRMMARMADTNNDGSVTRAEYDTAVGQHFDKVDSDRNGTITATERQAAHAAMKQRRDQMRSERPAPAPSGQ